MIVEFPQGNFENLVYFGNKTLDEGAYAVNSGGYDKRIDALLHQLPETVIATIELCGVRTPGLKPVGTDWVKERNGLWHPGEDKWVKLANGQWVTTKEEYYQTLTKFDDLEKWEKTAYELVERQRKERQETDMLWFIPYRGQMREEDIERTYNEHYDRIFRALINSTKQEETIRKMEELRESANDILINRNYAPEDVNLVLERYFKTFGEEVYTTLREDAPDKSAILTEIVNTGADKLESINKGYA
jgi:hypothetical protein